MTARNPRNDLAYIRDQLKVGRAIGGVPVAMSSPPTVGAPANSATISGRVYNVASGAMTFLGATWYKPSNAFAKAVTGDVSGTGAAFASGSGSDRRANSGNIPFITDAQNIEIHGIFSTFRLMVLSAVTGKWEIAATVTGGAGGATQQYVPVDFGSVLAKGRVCKIECDATMTFYSIRVGAIYSVWPYKPRIPLRGIVFGDSYVEGVGASTQFDGEYMQLGYALGIDDWRLSGSGGTGLVQVNGARVNYVNRLAADVIAQGPFDVVVIHGTGNDGGLSGISANLTTILDALDAQMPYALQVVMGAWTRRTNDTTNNAVSTDMQAALVGRSAARVKFIDKSTWITGTGKVGATVGDGNADRYLANDGVHRSQVGHDFDNANMEQGFATLAA